MVACERAGAPDSLRDAWRLGTGVVHRRTERLKMGCSCLELHLETPRAYELLVVSVSVVGILSLLLQLPVEASSPCCRGGLVRGTRFPPWLGGRGDRQTGALPGVLPKKQASL